MSAAHRPEPARQASPAAAASPALAWAAVAALAAVFLGRLGGFALFDVDEGAFAEASREMAASGDWGHTTLNGADRFDKPILVYWLQAAAIGLLGANEWAVRLPSALCALATLWVLWRGVQRLAALHPALVGTVPVAATSPAGLALKGMPTNAAPTAPAASALGLAAAWVLGTGAGFVLIGRAATADALLNLLLTGGGVRLAAFALTGQQAELRAAAIWLALGTLAKGPVALLIPGATLALWSLATDRGLRLRQALGSPSAWGWLLALALPWYAYALWRHGGAFIDGFWLRHNVQRFAGPLEGHGGSLAYYAVVLPLLWLPWSALLLGVAGQARRLWADPLLRFLLLWAGFVLVFFSFSGTKLPHYALYAGWPLAVLAARLWLAQPRRWALPLLATAALGVGVAAGLSHAAPQWAAHVPDPLLRTLLATAPPTSGLVASAALTVLALAVLGAAGWRRLKCAPTPPAPTAVLAAAFALPAAWLSWALTPWWAHTLQEPVKAAGLWARAETAATAHPGADAAKAFAPGALAASTSHPATPATQPTAAAPRWTQWGLHLPSVGFYAQSPVPRQAPPPGALGLVPAHRLDPAQHGAAHVHRGLAWACVAPENTASHTDPSSGKAEKFPKSTPSPAPALPPCAPNPGP